MRQPRDKAGVIVGISRLGVECQNGVEAFLYWLRALSAMRP